MPSDEATYEVMSREDALAMANDVVNGAAEYMDATARAYGSEVAQESAYLAAAATADAVSAESGVQEVSGVVSVSGTQWDYYVASSRASMAVSMVALVVSAMTFAVLLWWLGARRVA